METRANYATIGMFTLAVIAAVFAFVYWLARYDEVGERKPLMIVFSGSVTGLAKGGQVLFNGIPIGLVSDLRIDPDNPAQVQVTASVDARAPIKPDTAASLGFSALTGVSYIQLVGGSPDAPNLLASAEVPVLEGARSGLIDITERAGELVASANEAVGRLNKLIDTTQPSIERSVANVETFTHAIAANADGVDRFLANVSDLSDTVGSLSDRLSGLVDHADSLVVAVEPDRVRSILASADTVAQNAASASANFESLTTQAQQAASDVSALTASLDTRLDAITTKFNGSLDQFVASWDTQLGGLRGDIAGSLDGVATEVNGSIADLRAQLDASIGTLTAQADTSLKSLTAQADTTLKSLTGDAETALRQVSEGVTGTLDDLKVRLSASLDQVDRLVAAVDVDTINLAVRNVGDFAAVLGAHKDDVDTILASVRSAADDVRGFTADIRGRQPDFDLMITNARDMVDRLNGASQRVDTIISDVDKLLNSADGSGFFQEAAAAAHSIRLIADKLEGQTDTIVGGLSRFSSRGLDDLTGLFGDARQTLQRFDRIAAGLERDPGQIIFGGSSGIRDYNRH